jgi:outer membrane immunogenic protein
MHEGDAFQGAVVKKSFVAGVTVGALFAAPAMAGELPIEPVYAPAYAPIYRAPPIVALSWTGCYLGGHIGGSFIDKKFGGQFVDGAVPSTFGAPTSFAISDSSTDLSSTGFLGGGQVGCNLQLAPNWVIGIEADASWANPQGGGDGSRQSEAAVLIGTLPGITTPVNSNGLASSRTDFIATLTGRLGYTFGRVNQGMVYAKGGAAWAHDKYQFAGQVSTTACGTVQIVPPPQCVFVNPTIVTPFNFAASETRVGWTVGAGIEWAFWENWSVKLEYDYLDLGTRTVTFNDPLLGASAIDVSQRISEVKLGVNYRFGQPLPTY